ncbi:hypothetical protein B0T19DRAFT_456566 [Cercophora scortea]|uniref:Uncharacterized protein n=1 Tax=Cercophora scortea TaxID=314031 RepID=A0AAE0MGT4_9PEZI|nr:hypothetical protein B0T19DRAFT_456566 [Cercophora scortea]
MSSAVATSTSTQNMAYATTTSHTPRTLGYWQGTPLYAPTAAISRALLSHFTPPPTIPTGSTSPSTRWCIPDHEGTGSSHRRRRRSSSSCTISDDERPTKRSRLNNHEPETSSPPPHTQDDTHSHPHHQQPTPSPPPPSPASSSSDTETQKTESELRNAAIKWMTTEYAASPNGASIPAPAWFRRDPSNRRPVAWVKDWVTGAVRPRCLRDDFVDSWSEARRADWVRSLSPESESESEDETEDGEEDGEGEGERSDDDCDEDCDEESDEDGMEETVSEVRIVLTVRLAAGKAG